MGYRNPSFFINLFTKCLREQGSYKKKKIIGRTLSVRRWEDKDSKSYKHKRLHKSQVTSEVWVFDQESTQSLIGENVHGFDSRAHSHTHSYMYTHSGNHHLLCGCLFILSQRTIRGDITASITPATTQPLPHSTHNQFPKIIVSMVTRHHSLGSSV